jgi:Serine carboxypeptidase
MSKLFGNSGKSNYDISAPNTTAFPPWYFLGFLSQRWVQEAIGAPLNFTMTNFAVAGPFGTVGDFARGGILEDLGYILDSGIKVALVYGDLDYQCNWIGGEAVSLNVPWSHRQDFQQAGYIDLKVNKTYVGGQVRQYGNLSFTRVYQAGHEVPSYQPQTVYEIFRRAMNGLDIATGEVQTAGRVYSTQGRADTWSIKETAPPPHPEECYILAPNTCSNDVYQSVIDGTAEIRDYIVRNKPLKSGSSPKKTSKGRK